MKSETFHLELITPCFCAGAEPQEQAEIRAPSIRGQLRWWLRTLGGFKSLAPMPVRDQEAMIFGSTAGDEGRAGRLIVRVSAPTGKKLTDSADHPTPDMNQPEGYLLFPLRQQVRKKSALPSFSLHIQWRGGPSLWDDIRALIAVFAHLGALGFRGRRTLGAMALETPALELATALVSFAMPNAILIRRLPGTSPMTKEKCITDLGSWLRSWRQHGRSPKLAVNQPGFDYSRRDHNEGVHRLTGTVVSTNPHGHTPKGHEGETFRPALGLPIIQFFSSQPKGQPNKVNWEWKWNSEKRKAEGRFVSPVLLRPHRDAKGNWHALVIFVDAHKWPTNHNVQLVINKEPQQRRVSLDLYEQMKQDHQLKPFP